MNAAKAESLLLHIGLAGNRDNISHWKRSYSGRLQVLVKARSKHPREGACTNLGIPDLNRNLACGVALRLLKASLSAFWEVVAGSKIFF